MEKWAYEEVENTEFKKLKKVKNELEDLYDKFPELKLILEQSVLEGNDWAFNRDNIKKDIYKRIRQYLSFLLILYDNDESFIAKSDLTPKLSLLFSNNLCESVLDSEKIGIFRAIDLIIKLFKDK